MSEDFYAALMMRRALPTTTDIKTITAPGIYPVDAGNASAPDSASGVLQVLPPTTKPKLKFIKENDWNEYSLVSGNWKGLGTAATLDATTSVTDNTVGHVLKVGDRELGATTIRATAIDFNTYQFAAGETLFLKMGDCTNIPDGIDTAAVIYAYVNIIGVRDNSNDVGMLIGDDSGHVYYWAVRFTSTDLITSWKVRILPQSAEDVSAVPQHNNALAVDLNTLNGTKPGRYYQSMSANATAAYHYPESTAGSLDVIPNGVGSGDPADDQNRGCTQEYRPYNNLKLYRRVYSVYAGVWSWSGWEEEYSTANPPPARVASVQLGAKVEIAIPDDNQSLERSAPAGCVLTAIWADTRPSGPGTNVSAIYYKPIQIDLGSGWITIGG